MTRTMQDLIKIIKKDPECIQELRENRSIMGNHELDEILKVLSDHKWYGVGDIKDEICGAMAQHFITEAQKVINDLVDYSPSQSVEIYLENYERKKDGKKPLTAKDFDRPVKLIDLKDEVIKRLFDLPYTQPYGSLPARFHYLLASVGTQSTYEVFYYSERKEMKVNLLILRAFSQAFLEKGIQEMERKKGSYEYAIEKSFLSNFLLGATWKMNQTNNLKESA